MTDVSDQPTEPNLTKNVVPLLPKKIGPYKIESLLKKGGMSFLYLASIPQSTRPIVIKVLSPKYIKNKEVIQRFLKEAEIIRLSNHPNIIKLYGHGTWEHGLYIAMEFIQGISLKQFLMEKSLSLKKALEIVLQVSYALCHLHSHGIIHRDLKPENVLITENGEIKVIDFGIAQLAGEKENTSKHFIGTPVYMSPEQKENSSNVSFTSDIYSLGVLTYELVLGKLSHGIIHLSLIPKKLKIILQKALDEDFSKRYNDIVDFITDLSEYLKLYSEIEDNQNEDKYDEIYSSLLNTDKFFLPKDPPEWQQLHVAIEKDTKTTSFGYYLDFFNLSDNIFACILIETQKKDLESLIYMSNVRGYIKMALNQVRSKKEKLPSNILSQINEAICHDNMKKNFYFNFVIMDLNKNQLFYANSLNHSSFYLANDLHKTTEILINNEPLGSRLTSSFVETTLNFNVSDRIIIFSKKIQKQKEENFKKLLLENMLFSPKHQAEKILLTSRNWTVKKENELFLVICIERKA